MTCRRTGSLVLSCGGDKTDKSVEIFFCGCFQSPFATSDSSYIPKESFEECDVDEWCESRKVEEGGDVNTAE